MHVLANGSQVNGSAQPGWEAGAPMVNNLQVEPHGSTLLGLSFRPPQVDLLGLDARTTLSTLLAYPFHIIEQNRQGSPVLPNWLLHT
jgi:hypothetical protein